MTLNSGTKATVRDLRRVNRAVVLRRLFEEGPVNRAALSQLTGLSSGSITNVTAELLGEGVVVEVGREESDGGRPRALLQVNPDFGVVIGVEVGETRTRVDAFDLGLSLVGTADVATHPQDREAVATLEQVAVAIEELRAQLAGDGRRLLGVGVAVPGIVGHQGGQLRVHAPNIGWHDIALQPLAQRLGVPLFADNGAKALGQAEMWLGAGRGAGDAAVALWGTGVGAAIFTGGTLYRGATSSAGEWGHTAIVVGGKRCRCGASGCLEAYVGARAMLEEWYRTDRRASPLPDPDSEGWLDQFIEAGRSDDRPAAALEQVATYLGTAVANLVNLFNPELVVLSGWIGVKLGPFVLEKVRATVKSQALEYTSSRVRIEVGQLGGEAVALGASMLVVDGLLLSGRTPPARPSSKRARGPAGRKAAS